MVYKKRTNHNANQINTPPSIFVRYLRVHYIHVIYWFKVKLFKVYLFGKISFFYGNTMALRIFFDDQH